MDMASIANTAIGSGVSNTRLYFDGVIQLGVPGILDEGSVLEDLWVSGVDDDTATCALHLLSHQMLLV
jgi:hypothetical protein